MLLVQQSPQIQSRVAWQLLLSVVTQYEPKHHLNSSLSSLVTCAESCIYNADTFSNFVLES